MPQNLTTNAFAHFLVLALAGVACAACGGNPLPPGPGDPDPLLPKGDQRLRFESEQVDFGFVATGDSKDLKIKLVNASAQHAPATKLSLVGHLVFQILSTTCDRTLEPKTSCTIEVRFSPRSEAHFSTSLVAAHATLQVETTLSGRSLETSSPVSGLIGHWRFSEHDTLIPDLSGFRNVGEFREGVSPNARQAKAAVVPGRQPGTFAIDLSGGNVWARVNPSASIDSTAKGSRFSLAAWVRVTATSHEELQWVISRQEAQVHHKHFGLGLESGKVMGAVHFFFAIGPQKLPQDGRWHHIASTYDGTTLSVYQDGDMVAQQEIGWSIAQDVTPVVIGAGEIPLEMKEFFRGEVDEVQLFNERLSDEEVRRLIH